MNRIIIVLVVLIGGVIALGMYQGWFAFTTANSENKANVNIKIDKDKIHEDEQRAVKKVQELGHKAKDKVDTAAEESKDKK
ncbi:MAG: hypothetical protein ACJ8FY_18385 [Gemmataceae bacterium]